jgi:ABC-2 type transport system permease protein
MTWAIYSHGLTKQFPAQQGWLGWLRRTPGRPPAVNGVDLAVARGELFGLLGPNGAGKTTLIKMLCTLIAPSSGQAWVNGYALNQAGAIKTSIGLATSDERSFFWRLSGRQNLVFFAHLHHLPPTEIAGRVDALLEQFGLGSAADQSFLAYSTGMRQRLAIARAMLHRPALLFLDEPTKGLDRPATRQLHELIRRRLVDEQGLTVFLTTHYLEEAEALCDRVAVMHQGQIRGAGSLAELRSQLNLGQVYHMQAVNFLPAARRALESAASRVQEELPAPGSPDGAVSLTFQVPAGPGALDQVIDQVRSHGVRIETLAADENSLEHIFTTLTQESLPPAGKPAPPLPPPDELAVFPQPPAPRRRSPWQRLADNLRVAGAFIRRDFLVEASYRVSFWLQFVGLFFSVWVWYFLAAWLGGTSIPYLEAYGGSPFAFILIGVAFSGYFGVAMSSFAASIRQAQTTGTLEAMLTTPTRLSVIILSSSLWSYLLTTLKVLLYLGIGAGLLGVELRGGNLPAALLVLALSILTFSSLGILAASFIMILKRGDPITWAVSAVSGLLGGVYFPVEVLPGWLAWVARLIPVTYALRALRMGLLQGASMAALAPDLLTLLLFSLILLPLSLAGFWFSVRQARRDGSLTHY